MKKVQLEVWNTFDKLCLMSAITKLKTSFIDQNWVAISRYTKQIHENISSFIQYDSRSDEWFSAKQCSAQYEVLMKGSGARKKKKIDRNTDYSDIHEALLVSINQEFCLELQQSLGNIREEYIQTKKLIEDLESDKIEDDRLDELIKDLLEKEKVSDIKTKLKSMIDEKNASECGTNEPTTSGEQKAANITTSPLLTSLLQSPSPLVRPSPSTSSPTISLLLNPSPSVSLADPTLTKLLESPASLTSISVIPSIESPSFMHQGTNMSSWQSSSSKNKQSDAGDDVSNQKTKGSEEFERREVFDDMSDLEQGVVESEVIIENESSPIKRLPRRLDLENIVDEEPEEEILETVEEIIERVEEAIIETAEENSLHAQGNNVSELVINPTTETVSISDEEIENINLEDNTYEVIVVGTQEVSVPSNNEVSDDNVKVEGSVSKVDKIIRVDSEEVAKNSEIFSVKDGLKIQDSFQKSVDHPNANICQKPPLTKEDKTSSDDEDNIFKDNLEVNVTDTVNNEKLHQVTIPEEKPVPNTVISISEICLEKQSENDKSCNLEVNSGLIVEQKSVENSDIISVQPDEQSVSPTCIDDSVTDGVNEAQINKQSQDINQCKKLCSDLISCSELVKKDIPVDDKSIQKTNEEVECVIQRNEVEVQSPNEEVERLVTDNERQSSTIDHSSSDSYKISESKETLIKISENMLQGRTEKGQLIQHDKDLLVKGIQADQNTESASNSKKTIFIDSKQSVTTSALPVEKELLKVEKNPLPKTISKHISLSESCDHITSIKAVNEELLEPQKVARSCNGGVINIDSHLGNVEESVIGNEGIGGDNILNNKSHDNQNVISKHNENNLLQHDSQPGNGKEPVNTRELSSVSKDSLIKGEHISDNENDSDANVSEHQVSVDVKPIGLQPTESKSLYGQNTIVEEIPVVKKENICEVDENIKIEPLDFKGGKKFNVETVKKDRSNKKEHSNIKKDSSIIKKEHPNNKKEYLGIKKELPSIKKEDVDVETIKIEPSYTEDEKNPELVKEESNNENNTNVNRDKEENVGITEETQESFYEGTFYADSDESKSDSTEETEDNSIPTTEDSKDGLEDSSKFSSLETLSTHSDSPPDSYFNDPKFAGLRSKEIELRSLMRKGFEELKNKAAELLVPGTSGEDKTRSRKHIKSKNKTREAKKDKSVKTKKIAGKRNLDKANDNKGSKEKTSKDRNNKDKPNNEKVKLGRKAKYLSSIDSKPDSPSLSTTSSDEDRDYKSWKKSILLVYNRLASHKYASVFSKPITENEAPGYHQIILRPMDLSTIKRNIENGVIRTTVEFQRDMLLMVQNAIIYNKYDTPVYDMAKAMGEDMLAQMEVMVQALGDGVPLIGDTSEEKQITRARTSKSSLDAPQTKKRKTQEPDEIRPKRNKSSTSC